MYFSQLVLNYAPLSFFSPPPNTLYANTQSRNVLNVTVHLVLKMVFINENHIIVDIKVSESAVSFDCVTFNARDVTIVFRHRVPTAFCPTYRRVYLYMCKGRRRLAYEHLSEGLAQRSLFTVREESRSLSRCGKSSFAYKYK